MDEESTAAPNMKITLSPEKLILHQTQIFDSHIKLFLWDLITTDFLMWQFPRSTENTTQTFPKEATQMGKEFLDIHFVLAYLVRVFNHHDHHNKHAIPSQIKFTSFTFLLIPI